MDLSNRWIVTQFAPDTPGFWLLLSALISLLLSLIWGIIPKGARKLTLLTRFILLPYIGLLTGALSPHFMGLTGLDWLVGLSLGLGICFVILLGLMLVRVTIVLATPFPLVGGEATTRTPPLDKALLGETNQLHLSTLIYQSFLNGAEEFHWAFLRGALWELLLMSPTLFALPIYWAIWGSALLALPELLLNGRNLLERLLKLILLMTTSILFLYTRNLWLCIMLHVFAGLVLRYRQLSPWMLPIQALPSQEAPR